MTCLIYSDGGLVNKNNYLYPYGSMLILTSEMAFTHSQVVTYAKECIIPDTVEVTRPWSFYNYHLRKVHLSAYGVEIFNMFKTLDYIEKHDLINKYEDIIVYVDNKALYTNLNGYTKCSNPYLEKMVKYLLKKIKRIYSKSTKKRYIRFNLITGKDMKLILGH